MYVHGIRALFAFEGYVVQKITMSSEVVQVNLRRDGRRTLRCPGCGGRMNVHRTLIQMARDLPLGTAMQVVLTYPAIQGCCKACGGFSTVRPGGIDEHARATRRPGVRMSTCTSAVLTVPGCRHIRGFPSLP